MVISDLSNTSLFGLASFFIYLMHRHLYSIESKWKRMDEITMGKVMFTWSADIFGAASLYILKRDVFLYWNDEKYHAKIVPSSWKLNLPMLILVQSLSCSHYFEEVWDWNLPPFIDVISTEYRWKFFAHHFIRMWPSPAMSVPLKTNRLNGSL